ARDDLPRVRRREENLDRLKIVVGDRQLPANTITQLTGYHLTRELYAFPPEPLPIHTGARALAPQILQAIEDALHRAGKGQEIECLEVIVRVVAQEGDEVVGRLAGSTDLEGPLGLLLYGKVAPQRHISGAGAAIYSVAGKNDGPAAIDPNILGQSL